MRINPVSHLTCNRTWLDNFGKDRLDYKGAKDRLHQGYDT